MRDPADAALGRGGEQRRGRRARVRRAVMPEDGEPGGAITGAGVVNVQYAPVIQRKVGLCHHMTSLMTSAQAVLAGGTLISCPAPCTDNRSCRLADREGIGEGLKRHHRAAIPPSSRHHTSGSRRPGPEAAQPV
jgi:hypothetical protein